MNSSGCISLANSIIKTRGTPGLLGQFVRHPFLQLNREYHDPCEPRHLSWQWRVKDSPDVQRCSKLCLKKKSCPKKRFFPRFKKSFIYHDIFACDPPKEKKKSWGEYLSFLLPDDITSRPQMATCRKMLEHRRRKCMDVDNYEKCVKGECWPLPTEWYGQGVLHISELALTRPPYKPVESVKPCPPPSSMISKCAVKNLPVCPGDDLFCLESIHRKMPYSQFKGADTDGGPPSITLRCPIKYVPEMLPDKHQDRHYKLSCKTYGDFKTVECPPQMFNRYMDVDFNSKNLLPIPTTMPGYTPQREVKKGVCGRQTLLRPPSARNFSTGQAFMIKEYPEFIKIINTSHLQPGRSPICFDKLVERAGMDAELLNKPIQERPFDSSQRMRMFTEKELEKHEQEARLAEETAEEKQRRINSKKSKLQMLIEKQKNVSDNRLGADTVKSTGNILSDKPYQPFSARMVDLEEIPYQRSKLHTSARRFARKSDEKKGSGQEEDRICSGCPGIRNADKPTTKSRCSTREGGAKGRCKVNRAYRPEDRLNPLSVKCKSLTNSPCMRPRNPQWNILKSFRIRSTPCLPPQDSKRSTDDSKVRGTEIYGEKISNTVCFNKVHSDTLVPFRSPLSVVLGRSLNAFREKQHKKMLEMKEQQAATGGGTDVWRIFADRYQSKNEKKNRFTPFKDNNACRHDGQRWTREHEGLEKQLAQIDRRYKLYHSESSTDKATDKLVELQNSLLKLNESKEAVVIQASNPRVKKREIKGEMGEHNRRSRFRPGLADELNTIRVGDAKEAGISGCSNKSDTVSSFSLTLDRKKNSWEERPNSKFSERSYKGRVNGSNSHRMPKPVRTVTDQAIIDWRNQTAVENPWVPQQRGQSKDGKRKEDISSRRHREVDKMKEFRNTTDINVQDMKSAKITLKKLLQETSQKQGDTQGNVVRDAISTRPTARRRTIRAKCSKRLVNKNDKSEHKKMRSNTTENDFGSEAIPPPPQKPQGHKMKGASEDQTPMRPTARQRRIRDTRSERFVNNSSERGCHKNENDLRSEMPSNPIENQRKAASADEISLSPTARRRMIRAKCSELLTTKRKKCGPEARKRQSDTTGPDKGFEVVTPLTRKMATTSISGERNRAHQRAWEGKIPPVKKKLSKNRSSEVFSVAKSRFWGNISGKNSRSEMSDKMTGPKSQRRQKHPSNKEIGTSSVENEEKCRTGYEGTLRLRDSEVEIGKTRPVSQQKGVSNGETSFRETEVAMKATGEQSNGFQSIKKGSIPEELQEMGGSGDKSGIIGVVNNSTPSKSLTAVKESKTKSDVEKGRGENRGDGKNTVQDRPAEENLQAGDSSMSMTAGRESKGDVKDAAVPSKEAGKPVTASTTATNEEKIGIKDVGTEGKNDQNKEHKEQGTSNKGMPLPGPAKSSDYSEIWKYS